MKYWLLVVCVLVVAAGVLLLRTNTSYSRGTPTPVDDSGIRAVSDRGSEAAVREADVRTPERMEVVGTRGFLGRGAVRLLCEQDVRPENVVLVWESSDGARVSCSSDGVAWHGEFGPGVYELTGGSCEHGSILPVAPASVSESAPETEIIVRCAAAIVVDVRALSPQGSKPVRNVTIRPDPVPQAGDGPTGPVLLVSKERGKPATAIPQFSGSEGWALVDVDPPVVLPSRSANGRVRVGAPGHEEVVLAGLDAPGLFIATLPAKRALTIRLRDSGWSEGRYRVDAAFPGGRRSFFDAVRPPEDMSVALRDEKRVEITVSRESRVGRGATALRRSFDLDPSEAAPIVELDLVETSEAQAQGGIRIGVRLPAEVGDLLGKLTVELQPSAGSVEYGSPEEPRDHVGAWAKDESGTHFRTFSGLQPGSYRLVLQPLGIERGVIIEDGELSAAQLDVPELAELRVWPVRAAGGPVADPHKLGAVAWTYVGPSEEAARESNEAFEHNTSLDNALALNLALGKANFARCIDGGWLIVAPSGKRIALHFVGPAALGANLLEVELHPGPMEETLCFSGL